MAKSEADIIRGYLTQQGDLPPMPYTVHMGDGVPVGNFNDLAAAARGGAPAPTSAAGSSAGDSGMSWLSAFSPDAALQTQGKYLAQAATQGAAASEQRRAGLEIAGKSVRSARMAAEMKADIEEGNDRTQYEIGARGGFDSADPNNAFVRAMGAKAEANSAYSAARAEYDAATQTDFFSDPVGYITAQMHMPALSARVNNLAAASDRAESDFRSAAVMTKTAQEMSVSNTSTAIRAQKLEAARSAQLQAEAQIRALQGQDEQAGANLSLQLGNAAGSMVDADIRRTQRGMINQEKAAQDESLQIQRNNIAAYNARMGRNESPATLKNMTKEQQEEIMTIGSTGRASIQQMVAHAGRAAQEGKLSPDAQSAFNVASTIDQYVTAKASVQRPMGPPAGTQKAYEAEMDLFVQSELARVANKDGKSRGMTDPELDRAPAPYRTDFKMLKSSVAAAVAGGTRPPVDPRNFMFRMLLDMDKDGRVGANGTVAGDYENSSIQYLATAAAKGNVTDPATGKVLGPIEAAKVVSDYYSQMIAWQNKAKQYTSLGLPELRSYPVRLNNGTENVMVDVADKTAVEKFMSRRKAYEGAATQILGIFSAFPPMAQ